jgi:hypothetical protein
VLSRKRDRNRGRGISRPKVSEMHVVRSRCEMDNGACLCACRLCFMLRRLPETSGQKTVSRAGLVRRNHIHATSGWRPDKRTAAHRRHHMHSARDPLLHSLLGLRTRRTPKLGGEEPSDSCWRCSDCQLSMMTGNACYLRQTLDNFQPVAAV